LNPLTDPVELLCELVRTESVNPKFGGCGEYNLAQLTAKYLSDAGFDVDLPEALPGRPNVVAFRRGTTERAIGFCAHLDTVSVEGMTIPPFEARVSGGRVWGRGSADPKASMAAMICAIQQEVARDAVSLPSILVLLTVEEETSFEGARHFSSGSFPPLSGMIIGEPTGCETSMIAGESTGNDARSTAGGCVRLVSAHKGVYRTKIHTTGKAAHAATPQSGVNAIYRMARVVARLEEFACKLAAQAGHPLVGPPTLNIGTIDGGTAVNTVPDRCTITIDRRVLPGEDIRSVEAELRELVAACEGASIDEPFVSVPGYALDEQHPWARLVAGALKQPADGVVPYATDASVLQKANIPCLIYGPGQVKAAHSADECVAVAELLEAVGGYRAIIRRAADKEGL